MKRFGVLALTMAALSTLVVAGIPGIASADYLPPDATEYPIYAGRDRQYAGELDVWTDGETLLVDYECTGDWWLVETHLAVADSFDGIPLTGSGNPKIGQFAMFGEKSGMTFDPYVKHYTYSYTASDGSLPTTLYLSAQAVVYNSATGQQETAFANCSRTVPFHGDGNGVGKNGNGRWGWWFQYPPPLSY